MSHVSQGQPRSMSTMDETPSTIRSQEQQRVNATPTVASEDEPFSCREDDTQQQRRKLDEIIDKFRGDAISKSQAIASVLEIVGVCPGVQDPQKDQAFELYLDAIQSHEASIARSHFRGIGRSGSEQGSIDGRSPRHSHSGAQPIDRQVNDLINESRSSRSNSLSGSESDSEGGGSRLAKRRRFLSKSDLPWYKPDRIDTSNPACKENRNILATFAKDLRYVKREIELDPDAPSFPSTQWDWIIRGQAVDLDAVLSDIHRTAPTREGVGRVGNTEITFGLPEPVRRIETAGDWTSAWNRTQRAYKFTFPGRTEELQAYGEYIESLFAAKIPAVHSRVIMYDNSIRREVRGGQKTLLTDTTKFQHLFSAIMASDGIEGSKFKISGNRETHAGSNVAICNRFNSSSGCPSSDRTCKYKHVCRTCHKAGHSKERCDSKGKQ